MNNSLETWAVHHNVSPAALVALRMQMLNVFTVPMNDTAPTSEAGVQNKVRLEASKARVLLMRNNVGVLKDERGVPVRFGLANDSAGVNKMCKSSDLIGIRPVTITQDMVGTVIGQFVARECKRSNWHYSGTEREVAQKRFLEIVTVMGGDAKFTTGEL